MSRRGLSSCLILTGGMVPVEWKQKTGCARSLVLVWFMAICYSSSSSSSSSSLMQLSALRYWRCHPHINLTRFAILLMFASLFHAYLEVLLFWYRKYATEATFCFFALFNTFACNKLLKTTRFGQKGKIARYHRNYFLNLLGAFLYVKQQTPHLTMRCWVVVWSIYLPTIGCLHCPSIQFFFGCVLQWQKHNV